MMTWMAGNMTEVDEEDTERWRLCADIGKAARMGTDLERWRGGGAS